MRTWNAERERGTFAQVAEIGHAVVVGENEPIMIRLLLFCTILCHPLFHSQLYITLSPWQTTLKWLRS